jgi:hypothetical protein
MVRVALLLFLMIFLSCKHKKSDDGNTYSFDDFSAKFVKGQLPFQIADTSFYRIRDTVIIKSAELAYFIPDSIRTLIFGKPYKAKYYAVRKYEKPKAETYFLVKLYSPTRRGLYLFIFNKNGDFASAFPFLVDDNDISTILTSSIDKSFSISKSTIRKKAKKNNSERKEVYQYNSVDNRFNLIMTDAMGEGIQTLINPIDSLPHKNKFSADYVNGAKNLVSIRDGRHPNQLFAFIHFENKENACTGELKGDILLTSPNTAIYRQGGDPCVLTLVFSPTTVSLKEEEGCGSHRGLNCEFDGIYYRKKALKSKSKLKKHRF